MAEMKYYDSNLTGQELDEAFRNLANLDDGIARASASAEKAQQSARDAESAKNGAAESAARAKQAEDLVQQQSANLQNLTDNLEAVQNAAANAQAAAASAAAAQQAAQEALGFRTFFSAVTPDENGDLDPSRPMTTPTAASVTVKSKGDRIQSVQVNGFTQQAGSGDASPTNVREISTAGMRMVEVTFDGSSDENWKLSATTLSGFIRAYFSISNPVQDEGFSSIYERKLYSYWSAVSAMAGTFFVISPDAICVQVKTDLPNTVDSFKSMLQQTPLTVWYVPSDESQATGLYIPVETQGHEYRCQMMELTAPLCAGDKVESCVPSGCDKAITLDGTQTLKWYDASGAPYGGYFYTSIADLPAAAAPNTILSNKLAVIENKNADRVDGTVSGSGVGGALYFTLFGQKTVEDANAYLSQNPITVWYRSTAYTEANDIPVQLETHAQSMVVLDGTEKMFNAGVVGTNGFYFFFNGPGQNAVNSYANSAVCSHFKNAATQLNASFSSGQLNSFCIRGATNGLRFAVSHEALGTTPQTSADDCSKAAKAYISAQYAAGTPITIVYPLATPAIYAHDPVTLVAVPYTQADVAAANQLANTPSTLPAIDSPDVPMLLDAADNTDSAAQVMALAANAVPVAGTYVVSSQDSTTLAVSLKAMQDGGDAATLGGMTADQILAQAPTALSVGVLSVVSAQATVSAVPVGTTGTTFSATLTVPEGYTALDPLYVSVGSAGAVANLDAFTSGAGAVTGTVYNLTQAELQNVPVTVYVLAVKTA